MSAPICNIKEAGPVYWSYWQMLAYAFSRDGADAQRKAVADVLRTAYDHLCCESCRGHATRIASERGWDAMLDTALAVRVDPGHPDSMFACVIKLHNWVNERLGRDTWTLERAVEVQAALPYHHINTDEKKCTSCTLSDDDKASPPPPPPLQQQAACVRVQQQQSPTIFITIAVAMVALVLIMMALSFAFASPSPSTQSPSLRQSSRRLSGGDVYV